MLPPGWFYPFVAIFVIVMAVALLMQFAMLGGMFLILNKLKNTAENLIKHEVRPILDDVRPLIRDAKPVIAEVRQEVTHLTATVHQIEQSVRTHVNEYDPVISDAAVRAREQVARADSLVTRALDRTEEVGASVDESIHRTGRRVKHAVKAPVRITRAVKNGLKAGVSTLVHGNGRARRLPSAADTGQQAEDMIVITSETFPEEPPDRRLTA